MKVQTEIPNILVHIIKHHLISLFLCFIMLVVDMAPALASGNTERGRSQAAAPCPSTLPEAPVLISEQDAALVKNKLAKWIDTDTWEDLQLPGNLKQGWQDFADGKGVPIGQDLLVLSDFMSQVDLLQSYAAQGLVPPKSHPVYRARKVSDGQNPTRLVAYAVEDPEQTAGQAETLFMITTSTTGSPKGLSLAPQMDSLQQRASVDGRYVEYWSKAGKCILRAQGRAVPKGMILNDVLVDLYHHNEYAQASVFPRFEYANIGVASSFYGIEDNLTYKQILLLSEALQLFNQPELEPMKSAILTAKNDFLLYKRLDNGNAGVNYVGSNVIGLDRVNLFWNKYYLASVIVHEGSHVMQGPMGITKDVCAAIYQREIADMKIPPDLFSWKADEVLQAVKDEKIGTYHVSLWFLHFFKFQQLSVFKNIIQTGKVNGKPLVDCSANS